MELFNALKPVDWHAHHGHPMDTINPSGILIACYIQDQSPLFCELKITSYHMQSLCNVQVGWI